MPAERFICPDGKEQPICECLVECRMKERCMFLPTLQAIARSQDRKLGFTVTELIGGTREAYLKRKYHYRIDPQKQVFALQGNAVHHFLQQFPSMKTLQEIRLQGDGYSGQFDAYGQLLGVDQKTLGDIKVTSSYKIMKALGYYQEEFETGQVYKSGLRKGQPRKQKIWRTDGVRSVFDWALQLNAYRHLLSLYGLSVNQMVIQAICRDGSLRIAQERNIDRSVYLVPIRKISDHWITRYFKKKVERLREAVENDAVPPVCSRRERWNDRKCKDFCEVSTYCEYAQNMKVVVSFRQREEKVA
jgi:hypothetical protein